MNGPERRSFCWRLFQTAIIVLAFPLTGGAEKKPALPAEVITAKSIFIVNQTRDRKLLDTAIDQFERWGRFTISSSEDDADLIVVFTHRVGIDKWGNLGITEMDVYVKGHKEPAFTTTDALKLITDPEHKAKACIAHFQQRLSGKH